ncbi:MAG: hypothetical protein JWL65_806 [Gammaproteobacteria bacterium]|nr:hypothetical protein [Gammaproteobacteria bacterium]
MNNNVDLHKLARRIESALSSTTQISNPRCGIPLRD